MTREVDERMIAGTRRAGLGWPVTAQVEPRRHAGLGWPRRPCERTDSTDRTDSSDAINGTEETEEKKGAVTEDAIEANDATVALDTAGADFCSDGPDAGRRAGATAPVSVPVGLDDLRVTEHDVSRETNAGEATGGSGVPLGAATVAVSRRATREVPPREATAEPSALARSTGVAEEANPDDAGTPFDLSSPGMGRRPDTEARLPRPPSTRVVTVANQKGGVGKTTSTVNVAAALAQRSAQVLVVDLDPQGNASTALGVDHHAGVASVYDSLVEGRPLREVVQPVPGFETLHCVPATIDLAGAEIELVSLVAREMRLKRAIDTYLAERDAQGEPRIDYVLIDCPPSLGLLTVNALVAAREVLIPIQCEYYALEGLSQLLKNVDLIALHLNPALQVSTILLTMFDARTRLASQVADEVRLHFPHLVLEATIPRSVRVSEAPSYGQTVMTYDPGSSGAMSYAHAAREIAVRGAPMNGEHR